MGRMTYAELTGASYSIKIDNRQLTYVVEKDGNKLEINANPLYYFLKEMFTTDWKLAQTKQTKQENK